MNRLYMYLPPFAGDYSGVCSTFYELGGMICIHDAAGCTGNYTGFDEPRWYGSEDMVYCTGLRKIDAALGNDEKFVKRIAEAAMELHPKFIAIVGSPVPFVIGFDFQGVAKEIEAMTGIPSFGFATNGLQGFYKDGIVMATSCLLKHYAKDCFCETKKIKVNIFGATPLDISEENYCLLEEVLEQAGFEMNCSIAMHTSLTQIERVYQANVNIAISQAGLLSAMQVEQEKKIPYLAGLPIGRKQAELFVKMLRKVAETGQSQVIQNLAGEAQENLFDNLQKGTVLIAGDGVVCQSIKNELQLNGITDVNIFTLFGSDAGCKLMNIQSLSSEDEIYKTVNDEQYSVIIADPFITELRQDREQVTIIDLPQYGISSKLANHKKWNYIGEAFQSHLLSR